MYTLKKTFSFEAAHSLAYHDGKCQRHHGHSYVLTLILEGQNIQQTGPKTGMLVDFQDISLIAKPMIETYFDHHNLNETLKTDSPTSEWICQWIYLYLKPKLPLLKTVELKETDSSCVQYTP